MVRIMVVVVVMMVVIKKDIKVMIESIKCLNIYSLTPLNVL